MVNYWNATHVLFSGILWGFCWYCRQSLAPIVDVLEHEFSTTSSGIAALSTSILFPFIIMQIPAGLVLQIFSPEFSMVIGAIGLSIFSILFGFATSVASGMIINVFIGIFASFVALGPFTIAEERYGIQAVAFIVAIVQGVGIIITVSCQVIQSEIYDNFGEWRPMYWYYGLTELAFALLYLVIVFFEKRNKLINKNMDSEISVVSASSTHFIRIFKDDTKENNPATFFRETCAALRATLGNKWNYVLGFYGIIVTAIEFGLCMLWLIPYLILKFDYTRSQAALINGAYIFAWGVGSIIFGKIILSPCGKRRKVILLIGAVMDHIILIVIYGFDEDDDVSGALVAFLNLLSGLGSSVFLVFMNLVRDYNAYYSTQDAATGMINALNFVGASLIQILVGVLLDYSKNKNDHDEYQVDDFDFAFIIFPICGILSLVCLVMLKETYGEPLQYGGGDSSMELKAAPDEMKTIKTNEEEEEEEESIR